MLSKGSLQVWFDNLKQNKSPNRSRKLMYDEGDEIKSKPKFKKATPEKMKAFRLKLEREKKLNENKKTIVFILLFLVGIAALYFIISG